MTRLEFDDVHITYTTHNTRARSHITAVDGVSLALDAGATIGLAGESGCGKSTLAMSALRLLPRNARVTGAIRINGQDVGTLSWGELRALRWTGAAIVFQGAMHSLNPVQKVGDQIAEALRIHADADAYATADARRTRVADLLEQVDLPEMKAKAFPHELSGGQKQRIMVAMAMACEPQLILADEPTTALDVVVQAQVLDVLTTLVRDKGISLIMISHDLSVLAQTCERIAVMYRGQIVEFGPSRRIMDDPEHEHTIALASAFPTIGEPSSRLRLPTFTAPGAPTAEPSGAAGASDDTSIAPLITMDHLSVDFGTGGKAVDDVSVELYPGEIVALVGQSGSGKTTLARSVLGLQRPTGGSIRYRGEPLGRKRRALKEFRRQVQFVLQDPTASLNPKHSVYEAVAEGPRLHGMSGDETTMVAEALEKAELTPAEDFFAAIPQELSGGQRQRVVIAGALALDPTFLVADEPVASLDASVRAGVLALILRLKHELGLGALVITHDLGLAWNIADRVLVMYQGRIVESGSVDDVLLDPQHEYTRKLLSVAPTVSGDDVRSDLSNTAR
ncbi:ABC transporter ATP-binding protein [Arthrobacter pigmenti]